MEGNGPPQDPRTGELRLSGAGADPACGRNGALFLQTIWISLGDGAADRLGRGDLEYTPFSFLVRRGLRRLAAGMRAGRSEVLSVRMPLNRRMFVWASGRYWTDYGAKNHITAGEMRTMEIEGG